MQGVLDYVEKRETGQHPKWQRRSLQEQFFIIFNKIDNAYITISDIEHQTFPYSLIWQEFQATFVDSINKVLKFILKYRNALQPLQRGKLAVRVNPTIEIFTINLIMKDLLFISSVANIVRVDHEEISLKVFKNIAFYGRDNLTSLHKYCFLHAITLCNRFRNAANYLPNTNLSIEETIVQRLIQSLRPPLDQEFREAVEYVPPEDSDMSDEG